MNRNELRGIRTALCPLKRFLPKDQMLLVGLVFYYDEVPVFPYYFLLIEKTPNKDGDFKVVAARKVKLFSEDKNETKKELQEEVEKLINHPKSWENRPWDDRSVVAIKSGFKYEVSPSGYWEDYDKFIPVYRS